MAPWSDRLSEIAREQGYDTGNRIADNLDFFAAELGCVAPGIFIPCRTRNDELEVAEHDQGGTTVHAYRGPHGVLTERRIAGEIIEHKVKTPDDLKVLNANMRDTEVVPDESYLQKHTRYAERMPIIAEPGTASAVQQFLQYEVGIMNFWYFAQDCPCQLEESMDIYQSLMVQKYSVMRRVPCDGFFQGENTSTTMISPAYYQQYSVPQIKQFVDFARGNGKRAMVHMCGHLHDLMPMINETGMDGIHALTPAPVGDTSFEYAYSIMPPDTSVLGRFGAQEWVGRSKDEIVKNLGCILPHQIYRDYPFILIATSDLEEFTIRDLYNLRDAVDEYEQT